MIILSAPFRFAHGALNVTLSDYIQVGLGKLLEVFSITKSMNSVII